MRQLFKGGNYSKEETINLSIFCMHKQIVHTIVKMKKKIKQIDSYFLQLGNLANKGLHFAI